MGTKELVFLVEIDGDKIGDKTLSGGDKTPSMGTE